MKENLHIYFLAWLMLLTCISCGRLDGETVVEGQVVDRHTGQPIPHAMVSVFSWKGDASGYNGLEFDKEADSKGNFSFRFEGESSKSYALRGYKESGYYTAWVDAAYLEEGRNNKNLKLKMQAPAWVKVKLVNLPPIDTLNSIYVRGFVYDNDATEGEYFYNLSDDVSFVRGALGNQEWDVIWRINRKGDETRVVKTIYCPALDTVDLVIYY